MNKSSTRRISGCTARLHLEIFSSKIILAMNKILAEQFMFATCIENSYPTILSTIPGSDNNSHLRSGNQTGKYTLKVAPIPGSPSAFIYPL